MSCTARSRDLRYGNVDVVDLEIADALLKVAKIVYAGL